MSYNSKYKSSEIEAILNSVGEKQDAITDLDSIRSGASKGATAVQSLELSQYVDNAIANAITNVINADY